MVHKFWIVLVVCFGVSVGSLSAQQTKPARDKAARQQFIKQFDKDGDGTLSPEERQAALKQMLPARTAASRPASPPPVGVKAVRNVEYAKVDGKPLLLDMYLPEKTDKPLPAIVWIHGGGWRAGSKDQCPVLSLSGQGYAVFSINYRLTDVATFPAQIHDCKAAIRWIRAHAREYGLNPDRIGVAGSSAGGHLVALLGTSGGVKELEGDVGGNLDFSSKVQAVCDLCGPSSFLIEDADAEAVRKAEAKDSAVTQLFGGPPAENKEKARLASPVSHVSKDDPPFLIVHGDKDLVVPLRQAEVLDVALKKAGVPTTLHVVAGAGHGVMASPGVPQLVGEFFDKILKAESKAEPKTESKKANAAQSEKKAGAKQEKRKAKK